MAETNKKWVVRRNRLKFLYEAFYCDVAAYFELPPTAVWILYTLMDSDGEVAQQDLGEQWNFPKQTVNSTIQNLCRDGYYAFGYSGNKKPQVNQFDVNRTISHAFKMIY